MSYMWRPLKTQLTDLQRMNYVMVIADPLYSYSESGQDQGSAVLYLSTPSQTKLKSPTESGWGHVKTQSIWTEIQSMWHVYTTMIKQTKNMLRFATCNVGNLNGRNGEVVETVEAKSRFVVCRNAGIRVPLNPTRFASLWPRTTNSSFSVYKCRVLEEMAYSWQRAGQTNLLTSSVSLTGSFF